MLKIYIENLIIIAKSQINRFDLSDIERIFMKTGDKKKKNEI